MTDHADYAPRHLRPIQQDHSTLEQAVGDVVRGQREATDVEAVANWMNKLRHLDLKAVLAGMFGDTMPNDLNEAIDKAAEWAAANTYPKEQP